MPSRPPVDFGPAGKSMWKSIQADYDLEVHDLSVLRTACRTADRLESLAEALVGAPLTVTNARGDQVAQPLLVEQRQQSLTLTRLLASLRLPGGDDDGKIPQRRGGSRAPYGPRGAR